MARQAAGHRLAQLSVPLHQILPGGAEAPWMTRPPGPRMQQPLQRAGTQVADRVQQGGTASSPSCRGAPWGSAPGRGRPCTPCSGPRRRRRCSRWCSWHSAPCSGRSLPRTAGTCASQLGGGARAGAHKGVAACKACPGAGPTSGAGPSAARQHTEDPALACTCAGQQQAGTLGAAGCTLCAPARHRRCLVAVGHLALHRTVWAGQDGLICGCIRRNPAIGSSRAGTRTWQGGLTRAQEPSLVGKLARSGSYLQGGRGRTGPFAAMQKLTARKQGQAYVYLSGTMAARRHSGLMLTRLTWQLTCRSSAGSAGGWICRTCRTPGHPPSSWPGTAGGGGHVALALAGSLPLRSGACCRALLPALTIVCLPR